jgi:hypothetical protein
MGLTNIATAFHSPSTFFHTRSRALSKIEGNVFGGRSIGVEFELYIRESVQ